MPPTSPFRQASLPDGWIPFALDPNAATRAIELKLRTAPSVPATFRETARLQQLEPVWVPAWLLQARMTGTWRAERGDERPGSEGPPSADWDFLWTTHEGPLDDTITELLGAVTGGGVPWRLTYQRPEAIAAQLRDEPGTSVQPQGTAVAHLTPELSSQNATSRLLTGARSLAETVATDRCGGDRQRHLETTEHLALESVRQVWLPLYRGTYSWGSETHGVWVLADRTEAWVSLASQPSDAAERAAKQAAEEARVALRQRQFHQVTLLLLAPFALVLAIGVIAGLLSWLLS